MSTTVRRLSLAAALLLACGAGPALADSTPQSLPFSQDWSTATLITADDTWTNVPGIVGYRGDDLTTTTGTDPQTLLADGTSTPVDVIANQANPNTNSTGGVAEFAIANPVVALQGSGTADAPFLLIHLDTSGANDITVSYKVRDIDGSTDNAAQAVALQYRVGSSGSFTNLPTGYVSDATTGPSLATEETAVSVLLPDDAENQSLVQLRIITSNAGGNDEWVGIDDITVATAAPTALALSVADAATAEGDSGTSTLTFTASLNRPAPAGGVTFDIATSPGTADSASDYDDRALTGQAIAEGDTSYTFDVTINGDIGVESDETFSVLLDNIVGAVAGDDEATGTIGNDDIAVLAVHEIQGSGTTSPHDGETVRTSGIVTAFEANGFYLQTPDAGVDADPATSEGVFVFTNTGGTYASLLTSLHRGDSITLKATIDEFRPSGRPHQSYLTELTSPTAVSVLSSGNALPAPVELTQAMLDPAGGPLQLESYEGMRVAAASVTAISGVEGFLTEKDAVAVSSGSFFATVDPNGGDPATPRPFREPGLSVLHSSPVPPVNTPVFDNNPERLRVQNSQDDHDGNETNEDALAAALALDSGATVTGLVGVLDYDYAAYSLVPDLDATVAVTGGMAPTAVTTPTQAEVTISGFNMLHFYDDVDDAGGDVALEPAAFQVRLQKASDAICNYLKLPDIIGVVEVENLHALQAVADAINNDTFGNCARNPQYEAYLEEGNDVSKINVGFLVSTAEVTSGVARVDVNSVTQIGKTETFTNPNTSTSLLFDRPPFVLDATVNNIDGSAYPIIVISNHLLSLTSVADTAAGSNGWATAGDRARAKRGFQAERTAQLVQDLQTANPDAHIVLTGDFNAFEFNDGYVDVMGIVTGREAAADEVIRYVDSPLAVPLTNMTTLVDADHRYSYSFDGNAQVLDHILVNQALLDDVPATRTEHPRINADFGMDNYGDASVPLRVSDHDPVLLYIPLAVTLDADLDVYVAAREYFADAADTVTFDVVLTNDGPANAENVELTLETDLATSSYVVDAPAGFTCSDSGPGVIVCSIASLPVGQSDFSVDLVADAYEPATAILSAEVTSDNDPCGCNNSDQDATVLTVPGTDLAVSRVPPYTYLVLGNTAVATFRVQNLDSTVDALATRVYLHVTAPGATISAAAPAGWTCDTVVTITSAGITDGRAVDWVCDHSGAFAAGASDDIVVTVNSPKSMAVTITASTATLTPDYQATNNRSTASFSLLPTR